MARFLKPEEISADTEAVVHYVSPTGEQVVEMFKTVDAARRRYTEISAVDFPRMAGAEYGWSAIDGQDRTAGKMIW